MTDISLKYSLLDKTAKQEINDFMDFLLNKKRTQKRTLLSGYKKKILSVSKWSDSDLKIFNNNQKLINQWRVEEW